MSVSIGELDSEISVEGEAGAATEPAGGTESSHWAELEKHVAQERRSAELRARTAAWGLND